MSKNNEKMMKLSLISVVKVPDQKRVKDSVEDAYQQVNQISFQENFKALLGHYKGEEFRTNLGL